MPTLAQRLFACNVPHHVLVGLSILGCVAVTVAVCLPVLTFSPLGIIWFAFLLLVSVALGLIVGLFVGGLIVAPLNHVRSRLNGAPFRVGDRVQILCGRHNGETTDVYKVWAERNQVRVILTQADRDAVTDVYFYWQVCRC